jgi:hypothetical protein
MCNIYRCIRAADFRAEQCGTVFPMALGTQNSEEDKVLGTCGSHTSLVTDSTNASWPATNSRHESTSSLATMSLIVLPVLMIIPATFVFKVSALRSAVTRFSAHPFRRTDVASVPGMTLNVQSKNKACARGYGGTEASPRSGQGPAFYIGDPNLICLD